MTLVSVLLPVRDGEAHLEAALGSVLGQTHGELELIAIDDGSRDDTPRLLAACADPRLRVITNPVALGLAGALNRGLEICRGELIARQDADDLSEPDRLAKQVAFLAAHPEVALLGSAARLIDERGRSRGVQEVPSGVLAVRFESLLGNPFVHTSTMFRRAALERHGLRYDPAFAVSQDYDLWVRLLAHAEAANLAEPLVRHRVHADRVSARDGGARQREASVRIAGRARERELPGSGIDPGKHADLVCALLGGAVASDGEALAHTCLDLVEAFAARQAGGPGLDEAVRRGALVAARLAAGPGPGLARALRVRPRLPLDVAGAVPAALARRLRRFAGGA
jgi:hypothetical protein